MIEEYQSRLGMTANRMTAAGLDFLVVYADREHSANLAYLTGFDPRFEGPSCCSTHGETDCFW